MKLHMQHHTLYIALFLFFAFTQQVFCVEVDDLKLQASVKRSCVLEMPTTVELMNISSINLIGQEPGVTVGRSEKFTVSVDCGADLDPSNVVLLELEPAVIDGDCLGMNESPKIIRLCLQYANKDISFVEGEKYYLPVIQEHLMPITNATNSEVTLDLLATPKSGQDKLQDHFDGEFTIYLNIKLQFQ